MLRISRISLSVSVLAVSLWASGDLATAQEPLYSTPSVDYYINRTRGQDSVRVGMGDIVRGDLNRGTRGRSTVEPTFLQNAGGAAAPLEKPFSDASHRPTVSPYLNLLREDLTDPSIPNYHTLVRPQLQQIQFQQSQQRRNNLVYRQLQQVQARAGFNPQGSEVMSPTGHVTMFQNLSYFYPAMSRRR